MPEDRPSAADLLAGLERFGMRLGLEHVRQLLADLGDPHRRVPAVLVAGSNGKGSTAALLAAILGAAGRRTGLYTSPHLEAVEERIVVDGKAVDGNELGRRLAVVVGAAEARSGAAPTYFEALTVAAFLHFADLEVDAAAVEVGLGGRLDATNVVDPLVSVVTGISVEHRRQLGSDPATIAREKAGVFRRGRPALWGGGGGGAADPAVEAAVASAAKRAGCMLEAVAETVSVARRGTGGSRLRLGTPEADYDLELPLAGRHQVGNLALAVRAAEHLAARQGWSLEPAAVSRGVAACRWPGRLEEVEVPTGGRLLLDAAHNPGGVRSLVAELTARAERGYALLFGVLDDKEAEEMLPAVAAAAGAVVLTRPRGPRGRDPETLLPWLPAGTVATVADDPLEALDRALAAGSELTVVCGSIYLVGEVRTELRRRWGYPPPWP